MRKQLEFVWKQIDEYYKEYEDKYKKMFGKKDYDKLTLEQRQEQQKWDCSKNMSEFIERARKQLDIEFQNPDFCSEKSRQIYDELKEVKNIQYDKSFKKFAADILNEDNHYDKLILLKKIKQIFGRNIFTENLANTQNPNKKFSKFAKKMLRYI